MTAEQNAALARRFLAEEDRLQAPPAELCGPAFKALIAGWRCQVDQRRRSRGRAGWVVRR